MAAASSEKTAPFTLSFNEALKPEDLRFIDLLIKRLKCVPVMITGQQEEVTEQRFAKFYRPAIDDAIKAGAFFLLGAAEFGADNMCAAYLESIAYENVAIFDKGEKDGRGAIGKGWLLVNGFETYPGRDKAMMQLAHKLIAYLFENAASSGTFFNIMAFFRYKFEGVALPRDFFAVLNSSLARILDRSTKFASKDWPLDPSKRHKTDPKWDAMIQYAFSHFCFGAEEFANSLPEEEE